MRVDFRQGIISYQSIGFLQINRTNIDLVINDIPLVFTIASGSKDYLWFEERTILRAWTSLLPNVDQWIYIDIDSKTANRTFGITRYRPIVGNTPPINPITGQHWFDDLSAQMKVWTGTSWTVKIRIIVAEIQRGSIPISVSINSPDFRGTTVGLDYTVVGYRYVGSILFDTVTGSPITDLSGGFITTEDNLRTNNTHSSLLKFANTLIEASALQNLGAYTIVTFSDFGHISHASPFTTDQNIPYGIISEGVTVGNIAQVQTNGIITNSAWDWTSVGINAPLYCDNSGALTTTPAIPLQAFCAYVIDKSTILLATPRQNIIGTTGSDVDPVMTDIVYGTGRLSLPAHISGDPVVVGDNDPRLTDKVLKSGDTMTGLLVLSGDPVLPLEAATKQYVDNKPLPTVPALLNDLTDVVITTPTNSQVLTYNGTNWVNANNINIVNLPDIIVAGTATKVTYNTNGLITAASSLILSDIPTIPWAHLSDIPTTVTGYGITDVYTKLASDAKYLQLSQNITLTGDVSGAGPLGNPITVTLNTVPISKGGTGATTANDALNALLPSQATNANKSLVSDGVNVSWQDAALHPATNLVLGGIIVGNGLAVDVNGVLSVVDIETITSGNFAVPGDCQARERVAYGISTSAAPIDMLLGGIDYFVVPDNTTWAYDITVVATRVDGTVGYGNWRFSGQVHRGIGAGTIAITPAPFDIIVSITDPNWTALVQVDTVRGALQIKGGGVVGATIRWAAFVKTVEISY